MFSKDRRKFILNALGTNIPANINEVISRILKELECNFKVNGGIANIFSLKNKLIPYIFKHASRVKYASLKSEIDGITGQKTQEAPYYSTYALYSLDVILQLINKHNKEFLVDSLDLKGLDFTVTPMKVEEFKPKINNIFNIEFVNDGKIHGSIEDINSVINLNSLYKDLTYIESLCGVNYEKAVKIANDILCSLDNTLYHPDANFLQPFSEDVKKGLNTAIALLGGNPIKLNSEKSALKDFDYDNLDKYHIPDLPKLPDLPEFPDTSD